MKKVIAILLALVMVFSLGLSAFAAPAAEGKITIENAVAGQTYSIFKMFSFEPTKDAADKGLYKVEAAWEDFVNDAGAAYVKVENGTVAWQGDDTAARKAEFAKLAVKYAAEKNIEATQFKKADGAKVEFTNLELGYYVIDSSLGALCALTNTNSSFTAIEKNGQPVIEKLVNEDANGVWGHENTAAMGEVLYKTTVTAQTGAKNYVIHDKMEAGLTFNKESLKVTVDYADERETKVLEATTDYVLTTPCENGNTFEIDFTPAFEETLKEGDMIIVTYSATLNENAEIHPATNDNESWLTYGDSTDSSQNTESQHDITKTHTFEFDIVKTDEENNFLDGAEFELYVNDEKGEDQKVLLVDNGDGTYRVAITEEEKQAAAETVIKAGKAKITGLDSDTHTSYYLIETKAPEGFNKIEGKIEFVLMNEDHQVDNLLNHDETKYTKGGVQVINKTGSLLPETGGMGTVIFYVAGAAIMACAVAFLAISKKRKAASK